MKKSSEYKVTVQDIKIDSNFVRHTPRQGGIFPRNPLSQANYLIEIPIFCLTFKVKKFRKVTSQVITQERMWVIFKGNDLKAKELFLSQDIISRENVSCWREMISWQKKLFLAKGNNFLSEEINSCQRKLIPVRGN